MESGKAGRALLLDRDGVINVDHGYVVTVEAFEFKPGIFGLARLAQDLGYRVIVITNQSGIARGYYPERQFHDLSAWMRAEFRRRGAEVAAVFHCPYHRTGRGDAYDRDSFWRKPNPGMILEAAMRLRLDLGRSVFLGDQPTDMEAARAAGVGWRIYLNDHGKPADADCEVRDLTEAAGRLAGLAQGDVVDDC